MKPHPLMSLAIAGLLLLMTFGLFMPARAATNSPIELISTGAVVLEIPSYAPPTGLNLAGLAAGIVDVSYIFTATLAGGDTPIDYTWEATEQSPISGSSNAADFTWTTAGTKVITVTADNGQGAATTTHEITIEYVPLDIAVVFDVSGSMNYETTCFDCWESDPAKPDVIVDPWPTNGFTRPMPVQTTSAITPNIGMALCTATPTVRLDAAGNQYLVHEAELYSENGPPESWYFKNRQVGQGFWVIQRASRGASAAGGDTRGAYMRPHPLTVYSQSDINQNPTQQGAAYNEECFTPTGGLSGACWATRAAVLGEPTPPSIPPWLEYDFTPPWAGETHIWIRAQGAYSYADEWYGVSPHTADTGGAQLPDYRRTVWWQLGPADDSDWSEVLGGNFNNLDQSGTEARPDSTKWRWVKLGSIGTEQGVQQTLRIYQGSAGFNLDKIIFTTFSGGAANTSIDSSGTVRGASIGSSSAANEFINVLGLNSDKGPQATDGSATREACNVCNPIFGQTANNADCSCKKTPADLTVGAYPAGGTGLACTLVQTTTNQLLESDLFHDIDPLRSVKEAVKNFAVRLDPKFDQIGLVTFSTRVNNGVINGYSQRVELQCLQWAAMNDAVDGIQGCYLTDPISYTQVIQAIEAQINSGSTNIGEGLLEGLEELGVDAGGDNGYVDSNCSKLLNDGHVCDRRGAAHRVLILMTDGAPNQSGGCSAAARNELPWQGLVGTNDADYNCPLYYAREAANANISLFTIGIGPGINADLLAAMATGADPTTGDHYFEPVCGQFFNAAKPSDIEAALHEVVSQARNCSQNMVTGPRYVAVGGTDGGNTCTDSLNPCATVQHAVDVAQPGETIKVATGTYTGTNNYGGLAQIVYLDKSVTIQGGYTPAFTEPPDPEANPTILDAESQGRVLYITGEISPTIQGLQVIRGNASEGGGIYITTATAHLKNIWVYSNTATSLGGGIYSGGGSTIENSTISNNIANSGGGGVLLVGGGGALQDIGSAKFISNTVSHNAACYAGGVDLAFSTATLTANIIHDNTANFCGSDTDSGIGGGIIIDQESNATLVNNLIFENKADIAGSGIFISGSSPRLLHSTIVGNSDGNESGVHIIDRFGIFSTASFTNTILVSHTVGISVTAGNTADLESTLWFGNDANWDGAGSINTNNNYSGDPAFVDPDNGDYHIGSTSAAIDKGIAAGVATDIEGEVRNAVADLGADEQLVVLPGPLTPTIASTNGYTFEPSQSISVLLEHHLPAQGPYDIYLDDGVNPSILICNNVATDSNGQATALCPLASVPAAVDPGIAYELYSTFSGLTTSVATATEPVILITSSVPSIQFVEGQNVWAAGSTTQLELVAHQVAAGPFEVHLFHTDGAHLDVITSIIAGDAGPFDWSDIFDVVNDGGKSTCNLRSGNPCLIRSYRQGEYNPADPGANVYAQTEVYINQPSIVLQPATQPYSEGDYIQIYLKDHTPGKSYTIKIPDGPGNEVITLGETLATDSFGDSPLPVVWVVPASCGETVTWPDGLYDLISNEIGGGQAELARLTDIAFVSAPSPRIEVDGGLTWPAGSVINIKLYRHIPNTDHYLEFNEERVPTANPDNTFDTDECGFAQVTYVIQPDTPAGSYEITSFLESSGDIQAAAQIEVSDTIVIIYTQKPITSTGELGHVGLFYDISAVYLLSGLPAIWPAGERYTITLTYDQQAVPVDLLETNLALYYWDGSQWQREPTSQVDEAANTLTATPDHFSLWAVLGPVVPAGAGGEKIFLPVLLKQKLAP